MPDRVEERRIPNPNSFGSSYVASRFFSDLTASIRLPGDLTMGATYEFFVRVNDSGRNVVESQRVPITILRDEVGPSVRISSPGETVVEDQPGHPLRVSASDDVELASVRVWVDDELVAEDLEVGVRSQTLAATIDVPVFDVSAGAENQITIVVEAVDASGNEARVVRVVDVVADAPPVVRLVDSASAVGRGWGAGQAPVRAGIMGFTVGLTDDLATIQDRAYGFGVLSTLTTASGGPRALSAHRRQLESSEAVLLMSIPYPEGVSRGTAVVAGDVTLAYSTNGALNLVQPPGRVSALGPVGVHVNEAAGVTYTVTVTEACMACGCVDLQRTYDTEEPIDLRDFVDALSVSIVPRSLDSNNQLIDSPVREIRWSTGELSEITQFRGESVSRAIPERHLTIVLDDEHQPGGRSIVALSPGLELDAPSEKTTGTAFVIPSTNYGPELYLLGAAMDRRTEVANVLADWPIGTGEATHVVSITEPADGVEVPAGKRVRVRGTVTGGARGIERVSLYVNGELYQQLPLGYGASAFDFSVDTQQGWTGAVELRVLAADYAGAIQADEVSLPLVVNTPPVMAMTRFQSDERTITDQSRLNQSEFWVRSGGTFTTVFDGSDDSGLEVIYELFETNGFGEPEGNPLFVKTWPRPCPEVRVQRELITAETLFPHVVSTQYLARLTDNVGHVVERRFIVHPLEPDSAGCGSPPRHRTR
ncbi:MAG: hypothetical protein IPG81_18055 [Sandaracinaceae bacterium]|nr:hypothetical protein [Sandaracinaceae bacterium]